MANKIFPYVLGVWSTAWFMHALLITHNPVTLFIQGIGIIVATSAFMFIIWMER